ncbi:MAG: hypothetical protein MJA82_08965 [Clostridia bacterium]|nr:hypothetical protein [Clostridia bacterium]
MRRLSQEHLMDTAFTLSLQREELLLKKYSEYIDQIDNKELKNMVKNFKKVSKEHIKVIKDLMIKLNFKG